MKTIFFTLLILFTQSYSFGQYKFQIKGMVDNKGEKNVGGNVNPGDTIILSFLNLERSDTAIIKPDNTFVINGSVPYPSIAMIDYKHGEDLMLLDNSVYKYSLILTKDDSIRRHYESLIEMKSAFYNIWDRFQEKKGLAYLSKDSLIQKRDLTKNKDSTLYYNTKIKEIDNKIAQSYKDLATENSNKYDIAYIVPAATDFSYDGYIGIYNSLPDSIKNTFYGKNFYSRLKASKSLTRGVSEVGVQEINEIMGVDTSMNTIILNKEFFKKRKYTLIEFWASWCGPCRQISIELKQKRPQFKKAGIQLVGFSLDMTAEPWKSAIIADKTGWIEISDLKAADSPLAKFLNLTTIPYNIIVDSTGKIIRRDLYGKDLDDFLLTEGHKVR